MAVEIRVRSFANIDRADLELSDLLVLMGPNNAGKSTLATIVYAISKAAPASTANSASSNSALGSAMFNYGGPGEFDKRLIPGVARELRELLLATDGKSLQTLSREGDVTKFPKPPARIPQMMKKAFEKTLKLFAESIGFEIERCFGEDLKTLFSGSNRNGESATISVFHGSEWSVSLNWTKGRISYSVEMHEVPEYVWPGVLLRFLHRGLRSSAARTRQMLNRTNLALLNEFLGDTISFFTRQLPASTFYLPAARSGMLHSHKALAAILVRRSQYVGIEDFAVPKLPGVVADFIGQLLVLSPRRTDSPLEAVAQYLEEDILHGKVELLPQAPTSPEIKFAAAGQSFALHRTSSMVSEMAPVILFIRHVLWRGDLLIIEEPESHLHPASQVKFARAIALLITAGVRVAITTHSDYFLNQINNLIRLHTLHNAEQSPETEQPSGAIDPARTAAYLFNPQDFRTSVERLSVSPEDGISDKEFAEVADWLYNESAAITRDLNVSQS